MLDSKQKKLFDAKISYSEKLINSLLDKVNLTADTTDTIALCFWNNPRNYYLCKRRFQKAIIKVVEGIELKDLYNLPKDDTIYIKKLEDLLEMNKLTNLHIISNPPYGAIGANITDIIREKVDYIEFVNLLPANDYKRNKTKDLFNYQSNMTTIYNGFADAAVTTNCALIHKNKINSMTINEFEQSNFTDKSLQKYFRVLSSRKHYAIDNSTATASKDINYNILTTLFINHRTAANKHLAYSKNTAPYQLNNNLLSYKEAWEKFGLKNDKSKRLFDAGFVVFNTTLEKTNCAAFLYSIDGFRFISKVLTATDTDSWLDINKWLPKVDWTRSWTVGEILADYGYTEEEIKEVINDLENFKGMN